MGEPLRLQDLVEQRVLQLSDGYRTRADELDAVGVPVLRVAEVLDGRIMPSFKDRVHERHRVKMGFKTSRPGDVVVTTKGTVGRVARMPAGAPEFVYSPQLCFFRVLDDAVIDPRWLYTWFRSSAFGAQARVVAGQTDMAPYISLVDMRRMQIVLPDMGAQRGIADVVTALDTKIDVNSAVERRAVDVAASLLSLAAITAPTTALAAVADVRKGISYTGAGLADAGMPMVNLANAARSGGFKREGFKHYTGDHQPRHVAHGGDLLVANTDLTWKLEALGWPMLLPGDVPEALFSQDVSIIDFAPEHAHLRLPVWAHLFTREARIRIEGMAHGTTVARFPAEALTGMDVPMLDAGHPAIAQAEALLQRVWAAERESIALANLRDALLPALMSGQLRVRDAEETVSEAV